jgi:hypothetical protein
MTSLHAIRRRYTVTSHSQLMHEMSVSPQCTPSCAFQKLRTFNGGDLTPSIMSPDNRTCDSEFFATPVSMAPNDEFDTNLVEKMKLYLVQKEQQVEELKRQLKQEQHKNAAKDKIIQDLTNKRARVINIQPREQTKRKTFVTKLRESVRLKRTNTF